MNDREPIRIEDATTTLLARIARLAEGGPPKAIDTRLCPHLAADEWRCNGRLHVMKVRESQRLPAPRSCPLARYFAERSRLYAALALCGYEADRDEATQPIGFALLNAIDGRRDATIAGPTDGVMGLRLARRRVRTLLESGAGGAHIQFIGSTGTAKTMAALGLYFSWLWQGQRCFLVSNSDLRSAAMQRLSFDEEQQSCARDWLISVRKWPILFLSDLGAQKFDSRLRGKGSEGTSAQAGLLLDLLDGFAGQLVWDSNLDAQMMRDHADFGARIVSRLMADRNGLPIECIALYGADQRQHALRSGRALTNEVQGDA